MIDMTIAKIEVRPEGAMERCGGSESCRELALYKVLWSNRDAEYRCSEHIISHLEVNITDMDREDWVEGLLVDSGKKSSEDVDTDAAKKAKPDLQVFGNSDMWQLLCKVDAGDEFMKSTKAMEISGVGCLVQVSTRIYGAPAEAIIFVPGARVVPQFAEPIEGDEDPVGSKNDNRVVIGRKLTKV